ncbi:MAG: hypothetical protein IJS01_01215 [Lentisphaeria bacterium]|nr:hypothetical protein [Lentisphaeria bacterium]
MNGFSESDRVRTVARVKAADGRQVQVRRWDSAAPAPGEWYRYICTSLGTADPHGHPYSVSCWRSYWHDAMRGAYSSLLENRLYLAVVDGRIAGRLWYAWSRRTLRGNFGCVYTEPEFRKLGIMRILVGCAVPEMLDTPCRIFCCNTGKPWVAKVYIDAGFRGIHEPDRGPLALTRSGTWHEHAEAAHAGSEISAIRPGDVADQFDCDKFLTYTPFIWLQGGWVRRGPAARFYEFRMAHQEELGGRGRTFIAENELKNPVGYAFNLRLENGMNIVDFTLHRNFFSGAPRLLEAAAGKTDSFFFALPRDEERIAAAERAGFEKTTVVTGGEVTGPGKTEDLLIYRRRPFA